MIYPKINGLIKENGYVNRLANALLAAGLKKGDKLTTVLPNCLELMAAFWAAGTTGIVVVPASPMLQDAGLATLIDDSDTAMVIAGAAFAATLDRIRGELPKVAPDRFVLVGECAGRSGFRSFASLIADASEDEPPDAGLRGSDVFNIMYSSGTTGLPKGACHTLLGWKRFRDACLETSWGHYDGRTVMLAAMPLFHVAALYTSMLALCAGAHVVVSAIHSRGN